MIRLWRRRRLTSREAEAAVAESKARLREAQERWPEVHREVDELRRHQHENHFAALFPELGYRPKSGPQ